MPPAVGAAPRAVTISRADGLARALAATILDGTTPIGSELPDEAALALAEGMPRPAVRAALRQLETLGLVQRSRGGSARVIATEVAAHYLIEGQVGNAPGAYAGRTRLAAERPRRITLDPDLARRLDAAEGSAWLHFAGLRLTSDAGYGPLSCIDVWLASRSDDLDLPPDLTPATLEALLGTSIVAIEEDISAGMLTSAQARHLRARGGAPCLYVLRRFRKRGGGTVAALRDIHPAERIGITLRLQI